MPNKSDLIKLLPKVGYKDAATIFNKSTKWLNFSRRIQGNKTVTEYLKHRQHGRCPACKEGLSGKTAVHHVSYLNECITEDILLVASPTKKRPNKVLKTPPCAGCERLPHCASLLAMVHVKCHIMIHQCESCE